MKRRARLDYSTQYLPLNRSEGYKRHQTENERDIDNGEGYQRRDSIQEVERDISEDHNEKPRNPDDENRPLRQRPPQSVEVEGKEETVDEIIERKLKTDPITLIKKGKENQYGNFRTYYDHRYEKKWSDPRLKVLDRQWFLNKDVLDIGCNDGSFTLQLAIKYFPYKINGIDIDYNLINKAVENYILLEKQQSKCKNSTHSSNQNEYDPQQNSYKKLKDKLNSIPKSYMIDKNKQSEKLEETYLLQNAKSILEDEPEVVHVGEASTTLDIQNNTTQSDTNQNIISDEKVCEETNSNDIFQPKEQKHDVEQDKQQFQLQNEDDRNIIENCNTKNETTTGGRKQENEHLERINYQSSENGIIINQVEQLTTIPTVDNNPQLSIETANEKMQSEKKECEENKENTHIEREINLESEQQESINNEFSEKSSIMNKIEQVTTVLEGDNYQQNSVEQTGEKMQIELKEEKEEVNESKASFVIPQRIEIKRKFPHNVQFRMENYVESTDLNEQYDTICCFSTTKWIHLNFGDSGIKRLFDKVFNSLRVDGLFILEPQEWRSYKKKQSYSEEFKKVIKSIKLHPGEFKQYLLDNYSYVLEKEIVPELNSNKVPSFFKRVVYVFKKIQV